VRFKLSFITLTDQVLVVDGVPLTLGKVVEEHLQVRAEGELPRSIGWDKTEHLHRTVGADVKIPVESGKVDSSDLAADGVDTANARKPEACQWAVQAQP
jgi:hypothetical protein